MPIFHEFPYGNMHDQNYDWILKSVREMLDKYKEIDTHVEEALAQIEAARSGSLEDIQTALESAMAEINEAITGIESAETSALHNITDARTGALNAISTDRSAAQYAIASDKADAQSAIATDRQAAQNAIASDKADAQSAIATDKNNAQSAIASDKTDAQSAIATDKAAALAAIQLSIETALATLTGTETQIIGRVNTLLETLPDDSQTILSQLKIMQSILNDNFSYLVGWRQGYYQGTTGQNFVINDTYLSTEMVSGTYGMRIQVSCETGFIIYEISYWTRTYSGGVIVSEERHTATLQSTTFADVQLPNNAATVVITVRKSDSSTITQPEILGYVDIVWPMNALNVPNMIAYTESTLTASIAHIVGEESELFMYNGILYKATTDIPQYGTIVITGDGANCEETTVGGELSELKSAINEIVTFNNGYFTNDNVDNIFTVTDNAYAKGDTVKNLDNYHLYQMTADKPFAFNCNGDVTDSTHLWICIYNGTISMENCVAKYANDGASGMDILPVSDVSVSVGQILTISYYSTVNQPAYFKIPTNYIQTVALNDDLPLTAEMRENVEDLIEGAVVKKYLQYNTDGFLMVYIPSKDKYIGYKFIHTVDAQKHTDVWRIDKASLYDETLTFVKDLTTDGEWECAVGLYGRPTLSHFGSGFIGGKQHGNETLNSIIWFVDNKIVDITEYTQLTEWKTLNIVESTNMYDSNDDETVCCIHGSNHIFSEDGLEIRQSLDWKIATQMRATYMAMYPAKKEVANTLITNKNWAAIAVDGSQLIQNDVTCAMIYKESENIRTEFEVTDYPHVDDNGNYFMLTDNTVDHSGAYNKCYYAVTANNGTASVAIGDLWISTTKYSIKVM